jgi:hypothetical protein
MLEKFVLANDNRITVFIGEVVFVTIICKPTEPGKQMVFEARDEVLKKMQ